MTLAARALTKPPKDALAQEAGLAQLRKVTGGCQMCVVADPVQYLRMRLYLLRQSEDKTVRKNVGRVLASLGTMELQGEMGAGLAVKPDAARVALYAPQSLLFVAEEQAAKLRDAIELIGNEGQVPDKHAEAQPDEPVPTTGTSGKQKG